MGYLRIEEMAEPCELDPDDFQTFLLRKLRCSGEKHMEIDYYWWGKFSNQLLTSGESFQIFHGYQMESEILGKLIGRDPKELPFCMAS